MSQKYYRCLPIAKSRRFKSTGQKIIKAEKRKKVHVSVKQHDYTTFVYFQNRKKKYNTI